MDKLPCYKPGGILRAFKQFKCILDNKLSSNLVYWILNKTLKYRCLESPASRSIFHSQMYAGQSMLIQDFYYYLTVAKAALLKRQCRLSVFVQSMFPSSSSICFLSIFSFGTILTSQPTSTIYILIKWFDLQPAVLSINYGLFKINYYATFSIKNRYDIYIYIYI